MGRPIKVNIPHSLGTVEARRRLETGFAGIQSQLSSGLGGMLALSNRWEGDCLHFEGSSLGQKLTGRLEVHADSVHVQLDLPELLASLAGQIGSRLKQEAQKLLSQK